jgi:hypothetical protein
MSVLQLARMMRRRHKPGGAFVPVDIAPKLAALKATLDAHNAGRQFSRWRPPGATSRPLSDAGRRVVERLRLMRKNLDDAERDGTG